MIDLDISFCHSGSDTQPEPLGQLGSVIGYFPFTLNCLNAVDAVSYFCVCAPVGGKYIYSNTDLQ